MAQDDNSNKELLKAVLASRKDKLTVTDYVKMVRVDEEVKKGKLLTQITWFIMGIIGCTFVLWVLQMVGVLHLSSSQADKLVYLLIAEIASSGLLGLIIKGLATKK